MAKRYAEGTEVPVSRTKAAAEYPPDLVHPFLPASESRTQPALFR